MSNLMEGKKIALDHRMEEFKLLREEIASRSQEQRATERYLLLADAAIYSLLATIKAAENIVTEFQWIAWWLPPILGWAVLLRECESAQMISLAADYIRQHEQEVLGNEGGWETFLEQHVLQGRLPFARDWYLPWLFLIVVPAGLALYETLHAQLWVKWFAACLLGLVMAILAWLYIRVKERGLPRRAQGSNSAS